LRALVARLDNLLFLLRRLPRVPVESSSIGLTLDGDSPSAVLTARVIAPRPLLGGDLVVDPVPRYARLGFPLTLNIRISPHHALLASMEAAIALESAVSYIHVNYHVESDSATPPSTPLHAKPTFSLTYDVESKCIKVALAIPPDVVAGHSVIIDGVYVAGELLPTPAFPATISFQRGLAAGQLLGNGTSNLETPCVTPTAVIIPHGNSLHVFNHDGIALDDIPLKKLGLSSVTISSGYDATTDVLVLSDCSTLIGVRLSTLEVLWRVADMRNCCGLAVMSTQVRVSCAYLQV